MDIFKEYNIDLGYVTLALIAFNFILLIVCITLLVKVSSLKKKYKKFMSGKEVSSLEDEIQKKFKEIEDINKSNKENAEQICKIKKLVEVSYKKIGIVKYDAFSEMGGKLSFVLTLLDSDNNGFILNSMHSSREGCFTYIKEVANGESFVVLSEEEKQSLTEAIGKNK